MMSPNDHADRIAAERAARYAADQAADERAAAEARAAFKARAAADARATDERAAAQARDAFKARAAADARAADARAAGSQTGRWQMRGWRAGDWRPISWWTGASRDRQSRQNEWRVNEWPAADPRYADPRGADLRGEDARGDYLRGGDPRAGDAPAVAISEDDFLRNEADRAKMAIVNTLAEAKANFAHGINPRAWATQLTGQHPWIALGSAAAAGFLAACTVVPSKEEVALRKLARIERALSGRDDRAGNGQPSAPRTGRKTARAGLFGLFSGELFRLIRPLLAGLATSVLAGRQRDFGGNGAGDIPPEPQPRYEPGSSERGFDAGGYSGYGPAGNDPGGYGPPGYGPAGPGPGGWDPNGPTA